jgi:hypothetical protein
MKFIFLPIIYPTAVIPIVIPVIATTVNVLYLSLGEESEDDDDVACTAIPQDMMMGSDSEL